MRPVHHSARGHRCLTTARTALPQPALGLLARDSTTARRTPEPVGPPRRIQIGATRALVGEPRLELDDAAREARTRHPANLRKHPDGANRIRTTANYAPRRLPLNGEQLFQDAEHEVANEVIDPTPADDQAERDDDEKQAS
jgi:hypothetical protein